ncbi:hypothetical protein DTO10_07300 [Peribacillus butanolivorans]|uniref:Uncharacterized protein n=1 Tax=Peribacillus butanolivorans TaxID=421767 RepID=A0ABM6XIT7_9BACI|nr:hypothetical protein DTO10_07300 [Peribacillus butanolivorans]
MVKITSVKGFGMTIPISSANSKNKSASRGDPAGAKSAEKAPGPPAESEYLERTNSTNHKKTVGKLDFHQVCLQSERGQMSPPSFNQSLSLYLAEIALSSPIASDYILISRKLAGK